MKTKDKAIWIPSGKEYEAIEIENIYYCESDNQYTIFYINDGSDRKIVASKGLSEWERQLEGHNFCRIHSQILVNLHHVKKFINNKVGIVVLTNNKHLSVSQSKKQKFMEFIGIKELNSN